MEINKKHTLFGERATRVTSFEMLMVFDEFFHRLSCCFEQMSLTRSLSCKADHGDIDIVYYGARNGLKKMFTSELGEDVKDMSVNGDVFSILYYAHTLNRMVHVDFIFATKETFLTKLQYFSYNDFSGIFGMLSKKYHFKYGSEGFFKRYCDSRNNWHDILVSRDLTVGMEMLGYNPEKWNKMETYDDLVDFMVSSPMFDYRLFEHDSLNQSDKKSYKRPVIKYVVDRLRSSGRIADITDEDYYFKNTTAYQFAEAEKKLIEDEILRRKLERERRLKNGNSNG